MTDLSIDNLSDDEFARLQAVAPDIASKLLLAKMAAEDASNAPADALQTPETRDQQAGAAGVATEGDEAQETPVHPDVAAIFEDERVKMVDGRIPGGVVIENPTEGEVTRDPDPVQTGTCPACERGAPRAYALHNCGLPNPPGLPSVRMFGNQPA